jgi:two-component system chemotaxis response regulator CheY
MAHPSINLKDLVILVADRSPYMTMLVHSMLRGFGANKVHEVRSAVDVIQTLSSQKIDILLCDSRLPPSGGLALTLALRRKVDNKNRTVPILLMTSDARESTIKRARDAGANMVIAKPISPMSLYDRLAWIAFNSRPFVEAANYFGPDRRFKIEGFPGGVGRRKGDRPVEVAEESGPVLAQDDIRKLFKATVAGQD